LAAKNADFLTGTVADKSLETGAQDWNFSCGVCHVGGGQMEYDRNQSAYSPTSPAGDAKYFSFDQGAIVPGFMSGSNKAEVDCLLCHLSDGNPNTVSGAGRAWLKSIGCNGSNPIGPLNDPTCSGTSSVPGIPPAGMFTPGTNYDPYNRNLALKAQSLQYAASLGIGATVSSWGTPIGGGLDGNYRQITGITGVPSAISAANIQPTPSSKNCAACHARDDNTSGVPGMMSTVRFGYGNYFSIMPAGTATEKDAAVADGGGKNKVSWIEMGCKTGIGKRGQRIGAGPNDKWGMSMFNQMFGLGKNPGDPIITETLTVNNPMMQAMGITSVSTKERIPDQDVHDAAGMQCATCHYAIGSSKLTGVATNEGFILSSNGTVTIPAAASLHGLNTSNAPYYNGVNPPIGVSYPAELIYGIDHDFAQGDDLKDTYGMNNLDGTVSCESCHIDRTHPKYFSAPNVPILGVTPPPVPTHAGFPASHLEKIACTTCHISEVYIAPFRLKYRDWSTGLWKKGNETNGAFKNELDWEYDLVTGAHKPVLTLHQRSTKYEKKKITPVFASEMPIWVKLDASAISSKGSDPGVTVDDTSAIKTCSYGSRIFAECTTNADCPGGFCWSGLTTYAAPAKTRDVMAAAESLDTTGVLRRPAGNLNGGNLVPLFDGWPLADAVAIDTAARIDAMSKAGGGDLLKIFHANFDVTHGITPKEWALGGSKRGGCVSCHSSAQPYTFNAQGQPTGPNPNYSPDSVGFFEGEQHGIPAWAGVGEYDMMKNPFSLYADWDCTAYCGMGVKGDSDFFDPAGNIISGATCTNGSPFGTIDQCAAYMQQNFDATMGLPSGTAAIMGLNDGISALQGFMLRETVSGSTLGCNPFTGAASIATMMGFPSNVNNCMPNTCPDPAHGVCFNAGACNAPAPAGGMPGKCNNMSFRYKGMCMADADCNGAMSNATEIAQNPYGLLLQRSEIRARNKMQIQQGKHLGFESVSPDGVNQLWWPILTEQNPNNPNHKWGWDQSGAPNNCGAFQNEPCCTDPMTGMPASCSEGMNVRTAIHANQFLGYSQAVYTEITKPAMAGASYGQPSALNCTACHTMSLTHPTGVGTPGVSTDASSCKTCHLAGTPAMQVHAGTSTDVQTACGQCHGGALGAGATHNGATYFDQPTLAGYATAIHTSGGLVSGGTATPVVSHTLPVVAGWSVSFTDTSTCADGAPNIIVNWGDGSLTSTGVAGSTFSHTYASTRMRNYTVSQVAKDPANSRLSAGVSFSVNVPQRYMITGIVTQSNGTTPIANAYVYLKQQVSGHTVKYMRTLANGSFNFTGVLPGDYKLHVYKFGVTFGADALVPGGLLITNPTVNISSTKP
jgi:hypothetical protein